MTYHMVHHVLQHMHIQRHGTGAMQLHVESASELGRSQDTAQGRRVHLAIKSGILARSNL